MFTRDDIVEVHVDDNDGDFNRIADNIRQAKLGGVSWIRQEASRAKNLGVDQLVGQFTTYGGSVVLTGSAAGYFAARDIANANPTEGDGGVDIVGLDNVDIKGSMMRYSQDPMDYHLLVRPQERHPGWVYVRALLSESEPWRVYIAGGLPDERMPKYTYAGPKRALHGTFVIGVEDLMTLEELEPYIKRS